MLKFSIKYLVFFQRKKIYFIAEIYFYDFTWSTEFIRLGADFGRVGCTGGNPGIPERPPGNTGTLGIGLWILNSIIFVSRIS